MARSTHDRLRDAHYVNNIPAALSNAPGIQQFHRDAWNAGFVAGRTKKQGRKPQFNMHDVVAICASYYDITRGHSVSSIARIYKCSPAVITRIIEGKYIPNLDP